MIAIALLGSICALAARQLWTEEAATIEQSLAHQSTALAPHLHSGSPSIAVALPPSSAATQVELLWLLPNISVARTVRILEIELDQQRKSTDDGAQEVRLMLQGSYVNTRAALSDLLERTPDLFVEHVSWKRAASGTDVEARVVLLHVDKTVAAASTATLAR